MLPPYRKVSPRTQTNSLLSNHEHSKPAARVSDKLLPKAILYSDEITNLHQQHTCIDFKRDTVPNRVTGRGGHRLVNERGGKGAQPKRTMPQGMDPGPRSQKCTLKSWKSASVRKPCTIQRDASCLACDAMLDSMRMWWFALCRGRCQHNPYRRTRDGRHAPMSGRRDNGHLSSVPRAYTRRNRVSAGKEGRAW